MQEDEILQSIIEKAMDDFDHNKMNSIILETTAQVERKVRLDTILYAYGTEIIAVTILVLAALIGGTYAAIRAKNKIDLQNKRYHLLSKVSKSSTQTNSRESMTSAAIWKGTGP